MSAHTVRWLMLLGLCVILGSLVLSGAVLLDARKDAWLQAERASTNLVLALERDIARNIAVYDLSLRGAVDALRQPGIDLVSPEIRQAAVFDRAAAAESLGSLVVLDAAGNIAADSTSLVTHKLNLADREYFRVHEERADAGLYVSRPFRSRLRKQDATIAISRRMSGPDGRFEGVVVGGVHLAYFQKLFESLDLGSKGSLTLFRSDGRVIARVPFREADIDLDLSNAASFRRIAEDASGQVVGTGAIDGVERLYTFRRVGDLPLILSVATSVDEIYAPWWRKTVVIGPIVLALCGTAVVLCLTVWREMLRRMIAEDALVEAAGKLSVLAATDGLSGLANRRAYEERLHQEWKRAIRGETSLALLMLDADYFKSYNDHYGHQGGDEVLRKIATCIGQQMQRPADFGARYGGEEFVMLLPETDLTGALAIAERIRSKVAGLSVPHVGNSTGQVTVSIGVATTYPFLGETEGLLVKAADTALYAAKHSGRNRVSSAGLCPPRSAVAALSLACDGSRV